MPMFDVTVTWEMVGTRFVQATSEEEAIAIARIQGPPTGGSFIPGTVEIGEVPLVS